ncbi:GDSL-type esterase/lipase family protein [Pseudarthrobacter sp. Fe7]|nr:GDSL-type esterase/lipase family protein [Pseudarthrobacter sp. Fe7]
MTITAGGNNLGFGDIINLCGVVLANLPPAPQCGSALGRADAQLQSGQLESALVSMIQSVRAAAPNARIVLTGYPYLLDPIPAGLTDPAAQFIYTATDLADRLDQTIAAAAQQADAAAAGDPKVQYVDVRAAFLGHGALSPDPWINLGTAPDGFHPNAAGYQAYFMALSQAGTYSIP